MDFQSGAAWTDEVIDKVELFQRSERGHDREKLLQGLT